MTTQDFLGPRSPYRPVRSASRPHTRTRDPSPSPAQALALRFAMTWIAAPLTLSIAAGCTSPARDGESAGDGLHGGSIGAESVSDTSTTSGTDESAPSLEAESADSAAEAGSTQACRKVDLLIVVDNSSSMKQEQDGLVAAFPGFADSIREVLGDAEGFHVGVVTTDAFDGNPGNCDDLGDLVTRTSQECTPFASGARFLDESESDLATKFSCVASVGTGGSGGEIQVEAAWRALSPDRNAPGQCNAGFVRDDALLVLVVITDEDDEPTCDPFGGCFGGSGSGPPAWFDRISAVKQDNEENVVVLSLVGTPQSNCDAEHARRIIEFTESFTHGFVGDICAPSYQQFFSDAISVIDLACEGFVPPED